MKIKRTSLFAAIFFCSLISAIVTHAQQRLWGVSVNGELFSMNADGSDVISASSFGSEQFGYNVAGFSESRLQQPSTPTNLVFTTRNSDDWMYAEKYGKIVRISPTGLKRSNYFRERQNAAAHGLTDGVVGGLMHTAYVSPENKWGGLLLLAPGEPEGWYEPVPKANKDYSKEYCLITHDGYIYGVSRGDANSNGFIYKIEAEDFYYGPSQKFFFFNNASDGLRPTGRLSVGQDNTLFGYTLKGGSGNKGTFYKVKTDGTGFEKLFDLATKSLTKTEADGKYQTLLDVIAEGYIPVTDDEGNYIIHDATGIYRVASTGYLISKISSINADKVAFITPRFPHNVFVSNIHNDATEVPTDVLLQVNEFTGSNGYQLQISTSADFSSGVSLYESDDVVFSVTGLLNGTTYYARARPKSWPYWGGDINFTTAGSSPVSSNRVFGVSGDNAYSTAIAGSDKVDIRAKHTSSIYSIQQLSNGDKLMTMDDHTEELIWPVLYKLTPDGLQRLYDLEYTQYEHLASTIAEGNDGYIYSAMFSIMGPHFVGFFRFKPDGSSWESVRVNHPNFLHQTKLTSTPHGIYGISAGRQADLGFVYKIREDFTGMDIVHQFTNQSGEGARPEGQLTYIDGWLYGTARIGGNYAAGTIFKVRSDGSGYTVVHHFQSTFGKYPTGRLLQDTEGTLYGTTQMGGKNGKGIIYKINPDGSGFQKIYEYWTNFSGSTNPEGELAIDGQYIYATHGTLFRINKDGSGFTDFGVSASTVGLFPPTASNAQLIVPANLADNVDPASDFVLKEISFAADYTVQIASTPDFAVATTFTTDTTVVADLNLLPGRTYFARVKTSLSPEYGPVTSFATKSTLALTKVISPADGSINNGVHNFEDEVNSPYLDITIQPIPGAVFYEYQLSNDSTFTRGFYHDYGYQNVFNADGMVSYYGQTVYVRAKTNLSEEWGPVTKFGIIAYPSYLEECNVYPNPSETSFTVESSKGVKAVYIRDAVGVLVYSNDALPETNSIQVGHQLDPGIYYMTIITASGHEVVRLVKN